MIKPVRQNTDFPQTEITDLYAFLRRFKLTDSLRTIAQVNAVLKWKDKRKLPDIPESIYQWLDRVSRSTDDLSLNIFLARMARFLILAGGNDDRDKVLTPGSRDFDTAYNSVLNVKELDATFTTEYEVSRYFGRLFNWQMPLQANEKSFLGRAQILFVELESYHSGYSINEQMVKYFNLSPLEFIASGFAIWAWSNGSFDNKPIIDDKDRSKLLTDEMLRKFLQLSSGTAKDYRTILRGEKYNDVVKIVDLYNLEPFTIMPALVPKDHQPNNNSPYIVPHLKYLFIRATTGVFYLLADKEQEIGLQNGNIKENPFREAFGHIFREYVSKMFSVNIGKSVIVDLDNDFEYPKKNKRPDFAIIENNICVLVEVKLSLLTLNARIYFEEEKLREEVRKGAFAAAGKQIKQFKDMILEGKIEDKRFENIKYVIPLILGFEDITILNSVLLPKLLEADSETFADFQLGTITDAEAIGSFLARGGSLTQALEQKLLDGRRSDAISPYLLNTSSGIDTHPLHASAFETFIGSFGLTKTTSS